MTVHQALPAVAFALNASLVGLSLGRNLRSAAHRSFACFAASMAVWNVGVFMLRRTGDQAAAAFWEVPIHVGVVLLPAFYYHFVASFLGEVARRRRALILGYALSLVFLVANLSGSPVFLRGVVATAWGWAPDTGPLYVVFLAYFNAYFVLGIVRLRRAARETDSSFRRSRVDLVVLGTSVSLAGGAIDFAHALLARVFPWADAVYPMGIPANTLFALMLGASIVRYRMFDVALTVKKAAVYVALAIALAALVNTAVHLLGDRTWLAALLGSIAVLLLLPLGRRLDALVDRVIGGGHRGCYETLLRLSRQMGALADVTALTDMLVSGLVRGIPLTHCVLVLREGDAPVFSTVRTASTEGEVPAVTPLAADGALARRLARADVVAVREELELDPRTPDALLAELRGIPGTVLAPLKIDETVTGILVLGEKLSGEIFTASELEVVGILANQAATALENARLYERAQRTYEELARTQHELVQAQKMEAIGRLAGGVAHDFNNLLTVLLGRADILLDELDAADPLRRDALLIQQTAERASALTRQLLAFSRKQVLQTRPVELNALVTGLAPMLRRLIGEDVELVTLPAEGELTVKADPGQIEQVIVNLAVNARDAMPRGGRLTIRTGRAGPEAPDCVELVVIDTGVGMDEDLRAHIFEPFFTTKRRGSGTGLGLATVYGIVTQSGGDIRVDSKPGHGATFTVTLPLLTEPVAPASVGRPRAAVARGTETVLLVEDEDEVRALVRDTLVGHGYRVLEAANGTDALVLAERHPGPIHLLLTDVVMPRMSGPDLARTLTTARPATRVLYMSGYTDLRGGPADEPGSLIQKPFARDALARRVRERLDQEA